MVFHMYTRMLSLWGHIVRLPHTCYDNLSICTYLRDEPQGCLQVDGSQSNCLCVSISHVASVSNRCAHVSDALNIYVYINHIMFTLPPQIE